MMPRLLSLTVAALAVLVTPSGHACPVGPGQLILEDPTRYRDSADVVAIVTVVATTKTEQWAAQVELIVERTWKGEVGPRWTVTQDLSTDCDSLLERNVRYVIFATRKDDGKFSIAGIASGALGIVADRLDASPPPLPVVKQ